MVPQPFLNRNSNGIQEFSLRRVWQLLLLDEPAAGMNPSEVTELSRLVERIRDRGITVMLVEHHIRFIMTIADTVTVLSAGSIIASGPPAAVQRDAAVMAAYLGQDNESAFHS